MTGDETPDEYEQERFEASSQPAIGFRTAFVLYGLLIGAAFLTLKGKPLILALVIVAALAGKSLVHWARERAEQ